MATVQKDVLSCEHCGSTDWQRSFTAETIFKGGPGNTVLHVRDSVGQYDGRLTCMNCHEEYEGVEPIVTVGRPEGKEYR